MTSHAEFVKLADGGHAEMGTFVHAGREFTNSGSIVDPIAGRALLYSSDKGDLTSWDGTLRYPATFGTWHRFGFGYQTKRRSVRAVILGQVWHGWEYNTHQIVRLRVSKYNAPRRAR
jgi:hypothetical protein